MEREVPLEDLKKLYTSSDMVKADCNGCRGCSDCCRGMGQSIILDPLDIHRLKTNLGVGFQMLMQDKIELQAAEGSILPNLKMNQEGEACAFLDEEGRCRIHAFRPGLCRIFPLGRFYEDGAFRYYLQSRECKMTKRSKIKVSKWVDTPDLKKYESFIARWHYFLKDIQIFLADMKDEQLTKELNMYVLNSFYVEDFDGSLDFYGQFEERIRKTEKLLEVMRR